MPEHGLGTSVGIHVILFPQNGGSYKLWQNSGFGDDPKMKDLPVVSSLEIEITGTAAQMSIALDTTYDQGMAFLNSELGLPHCSVEAWIDYPDLGLSTSHYYGEVQTPDVSISPDGVQITLPVAGSDRPMMRRQSKSVWGDTDVMDVIAKIVDNYGYKPENIVYGKKAFWDLQAQRALCDQFYYSDWRFIQEMVRMYQCEMYFGTNPETEKPAIIIKSVSEIRATDPVKRFVMRGGVDPTVQIYPLLSFNSQSTWFFQSASSKGTISLDVDPDTKKVSKETVDSTTTATPSSTSKVLDGPTAERPASPVGQKEPAMDGEKQVGQNIPIPASDKNRKKKLEGHTEESIKKSGLTATCGTVGIPDLVPKEAVNLIVTHGGKNSVIDGNYFISSVKHSASGSGWDTEFECYKRGYPPGLQAANDAPGQVADRQAETRPQGKNIEHEEIDMTEWE